MAKWVQLFIKFVLRYVLHWYIDDLQPVFAY